MNAATRIAIVGYGNLGRGVEAALAHHPDMQLVGIFTRRDPQTLQPAVPGTPVHAISALPQFRDAVDVAILCGGSKDDLPQQGPALAAMFHTVDSFDTHAAIPAYFAAVDSAARAANKVALISIGWDPGLFSPRSWGASWSAIHHSHSRSAGGGAQWATSDLEHAPTAST